MAEKTKIALFADVMTRHLDGVTHTIYNLIERIPKDRFEFLIITAVPPKEPLPWKTITVKKLNIFFNSSYSMGFPFYDKGLKSKLDDFDPDIIHFSSPSLLGIWALKYGRKKGIPVFSIYHTHFISYMDFYFHHLPFMIPVSKFIIARLMRKIYNKCSRLFVPTSSIMDELEQLGIESKRMSVWGRGVNTDLFSPGKKDRDYLGKLGEQDKKTVLFVSRIVWEKDIETLSLIYKKIMQERPDIQLMITGDGPQYKALKKMLPGVVFTEKLIKEDLARVYASADVFAFPSPTETFGNVVLESLSSGVPAVVAAQGGPKGIVDHGITGYHAETKNVDDFYQKLIKLIDNDKLRNKMGNAAREYALSQSWNKLAERMFKHYEGKESEEKITV